MLRARLMVCITSRMLVLLRHTAGVSTLGNKNVYPGYASTRYGKRIMEFSLKYSF